MELPSEYKEHMNEILGDKEYESFISVYDDDHEREYGLRMNKLKSSESCDGTGFHLTAIPWALDGYYYLPDERPGKSVFHEAGAYYIQEPSAMSAVPLLKIEPGEIICDLCAAPGGKSTQIASALGRTGLLVSNEIIKNRADILSRNIERMGIGNCIVTNEDPSDMAALFPCFFDKILVDAPCSGEGMFRKEDNAVVEWSLDNVHMCAKRQRMILDFASQMVRPGGVIVYSTCTFEPEEDEMTACDFVSEHPEFRIDPVSCSEGEEPARSEWGSGNENVSGAIRIWPHHAHGEGHFAVRFVKDGIMPDRIDESAGCINGDFMKKNRSSAVCMDIISSVCTSKASSEIMKGKRPYDFGGQIYAVPVSMRDMKGLSVRRPGLQIASLDDKGKTSRFEPAHALAMHLRADESKRVYDMDINEAEKYLRGESISVSAERLMTDEGESSDGWVLMMYGGYSTGWGKKTGHVIKNHYPKGLRRDVSQRQ